MLILYRWVRVYDGAWAWIVRGMRRSEICFELMKCYV